MPDLFDFNDDFWMMSELFPEDIQEPTEDPPSEYPPGYDEANCYDDDEGSQYD
jgi:hypothetical protein